MFQELLIAFSNRRAQSLESNDTATKIGNLEWAVQSILEKLRDLTEQLPTASGRMTGPPATAIRLMAMGLTPPAIQAMAIGRFTAMQAMAMAAGPPAGWRSIAPAGTEAGTETEWTAAAKRATHRSPREPSRADKSLGAARRCQVR
jgi:hypothetical protein